MGMINSVKRQVFFSLKAIFNGEAESDIADVIQKYSAQAIVVAFQILWTYKMDQAFINNSLQAVFDWINKIVIIISTMKLEYQFECARNILISELTHMKNATNFIQQSQDQSFEWSMQLKFYPKYKNEQ